MKWFLALILSVLISEISLAQIPVKAALKSAGPENFLKIPAGSFESFYEKKNSANRIEVREYYLDKYAVTNADYSEFLQENPEWSKGKVARLFADTNYLMHWNSDTFLENHPLSPVINVSWFAASAYCSWRGKRLPDTSEWEYAASQELLTDDGSKTIPVLEIILDWYSKPNQKVLPEVGSGYQNIFGISDMHGLIWEWTADFNSYVTGGDSRSSDELERNLFCASGSFGAVDKKNYAAFMRYGFRGSLKGNYCIRNLGFRCAGDSSANVNRTQ
jgi:formylglycine-generating enzyme required for sulfatase activity